MTTCNFYPAVSEAASIIIKNLKIIHLYISEYIEVTGCEVYFALEMKLLFGSKSRIFVFPTIFVVNCMSKRGS